jgi:hypothetical protein
MLIHIPMHFLFWVFNETSMKRYRDIAELANGRELKDGKIVKYFQFPTFMKAMDIVNSLQRLLTRLTTIRLLRLDGEPSNCP